jgi:hypothetical protein
MYVFAIILSSDSSTADHWHEVDMDRRSGRSQAHPVLWTTATVRKRRSRGDSVLGYMRRYLGRMVIVLTLQRFSRVLIPCRVAAV